jgi:hypothetical protein
MATALDGRAAMSLASHPDKVPQAKRGEATENMKALNRARRSSADETELTSGQAKF